MTGANKKVAEARKYINNTIYEIKNDRKKLAASGLVILLVITSFYGIILAEIDPASFFKESQADFRKDIVSSVSLRILDTDVSTPVIVDYTDPVLGLVATPVALWYNSVGKPNLRPLLMYDPSAPSDSIMNFIANMRYSQATVIGNHGPAYYLGSVEISRRFPGTIEDISLSIAKSYWFRSDGAVIVEYSDEGYEQAVNLVAAASYLNIPVIVTKSMNRDVITTLMGLDVKYTLVAGNIGGYGNVMRFNNNEEIQDFMINLIRHRLRTEPEYIAVANPLDIKRPVVLEESVILDTKGVIPNSNIIAYPGAPPVAADGPFFYFTVPEDYTFARLIVDVRMDITEATGKPLAPFLSNDADSSGERIYGTIGIDVNNDRTLTDSINSPDIIMHFGGSPGYDIIRDNGGKPLEAWYYTEIPLNNITGRLAIELMARIPTIPSQKAAYTMRITVQKLAVPQTPAIGDILRNYDRMNYGWQEAQQNIPVDTESMIYPQMVGLSSLAPYLAAYRRGVVMAYSEFNVYENSGNNLTIYAYPANTRQGAMEANHHAIAVKNRLTALLGKIHGIEIKDKEDWSALQDIISGISVKHRVHVGIIADTMMVTQYYELSRQDYMGGPAKAGYGMPNDNFYSGINIAPDTNMTVDPFTTDGRPVELIVPTGRLVGWDGQDVSALIARTFFYYELIDKIIVNDDPMVGSLSNYGLSKSWKDNAMSTIGTDPPVGLSRTTAAKLNMAWGRAGFYTTEAMGITALHGNIRSRRQFSHPFYESSNFIYFGVHGFHYWYVPSSSEGGRFLPSTGGGSAFDVPFVKEMSMGPSVIFGSSCVTGKIDSLYPRNAISLAFIHAGVNAYVGATRSSWGSMLYIPDSSEAESLGDLVGMRMYGHLTGFIYDKQDGLVTNLPSEYSDTTTGVALMLAKNRYIEKVGYDNGGANSDTINQFHVIGDPAFNPYVPIHG